MKISSNDDNKKVLVLAIPDAKISSAQIKAIKSAAAYANKKGIGFKVVVVNKEAEHYFNSKNNLFIKYLQGQRKYCINYTGFI